MKNLIITSIFSIALSGVALGANAAGNAQNGEKLASNCTACHGTAGNSTTPMFPKLSDLGEKYLFKQLRDIKNAGDNGDPKKTRRMIPEMDGLLKMNSEQDLEDLAAYYAAQPMQLAGSKDIKVQVNSGAMVDGLELGAKVYRAGNPETAVPACMGCHSPTGMGNAPAGYPRLSGQHAQYIEKQLKDFRAGYRKNDGESMVMRQIAKNLTDAEIKAVANFVAGLN